MIIEVNPVRKIERHIISFILALSMLFSGMCFENVKADFSLEHIAMQKPGNDMISYDTSISSEEACTAEMLGIRGISSIRQFINRSRYERRDAKISLEFLHEDAQMHLYSHFFAAANAVPFSKRYVGAVVLNYIHSKDGKKRI